jgi:FkbM family methyltransferase
MPFRNRAKDVLHRVGLYTQARAIYRRLNADIRRQRSHEIEFYGQCFRPGSLCFDIGANLGQKTEVFLACGARVVTVEPNPHCYPTLKAEFGRQPRCNLVQAAVGAPNAKTVELFTHLADSTGSVRADWHRKVFGADQHVRAIRVPVTTLEALREQYGRPDFIKIDVEGYEKEVLSGLATPVPMLSFEYHLNELDRTHECLSLLERLARISVRATDQNCRWAGPMTTPADWLRSAGAIADETGYGDLFVWSEV